MNVMLIVLLLFNTAGRRPLIYIPTDRQTINGDTTHAEGWVPENRAGLFAVVPHDASPAVWIQPFVPDAPGGRITATIHLGAGSEGAQEWFDVYLLSCKPKHELVADKTSFAAIDRVCRRSDPVTVYRAR